MKKPDELRPEATRLLVVEGTHEAYAFRGCFAPNVQVISCDGKDKLAGFLRGLSLSSGFEDQIERLVVILDNDLDPVATEAAAQKAFEGLTKHCKFVPVPGIGINGMFEDLLLRDNVLPAENQCIDQFFACLSAKPANGKARMQAWLAMQAPGRMLGSAITEGRVKRDGLAFNSLVDRIRTALG